MKGTKLYIVIIIAFLASSTVSISQYVNEDNEIKMFFTISELDVVKFVNIPTDVEFRSIIIEDHKFIEIVEKKPEMVFYTTNEGSPSFEKPEMVYGEPYRYELIKKGDRDVIRLYVPSAYYRDGRKYTTTEITLRICFDGKEQPIKPTHEPQDPDYEYLIITTETFWSIFNNHFKDWKIANDNKINNIVIKNITDILVHSSVVWVNGSRGDATNTTAGNPWIPDGKEVTSSYHLFNDTQAQIRNYIRFLYDNAGTRYVLLGGNKNIVPPRMICSWADGSGSCSDPHNDLSHASDMYYACLHYCMNNNTNSYWMENPSCGHQWDEVDWGFDLCVGRVPFSSTSELYLWINKTKVYTDGNSQGNYLGGFIVCNKDVGNNIVGTTWSMIGDEFPANFTFVDDTYIKTQGEWDKIDNYCNGDESDFSGIHMLFHAGHGGTLWTPYSSTNCNNVDTPNLVYTEGCHTADFGTDTSSRMESWMSDNGCAFAGIANSAYGWFVASTYYVEEMLRQIFGDNHTTVFCQAHNDAREIVGHGVGIGPTEGVFAMIYKETNFFGDPALEYQWHQPPQFIFIDGSGNGTTVYSPNPTFNWTIKQNASQYWLQISNSSDFSDWVVNITNVNQLVYPSYCTVDTTRVSFTLPPLYSLPVYKTYYCRVMAYIKGEQ